MVRWPQKIVAGSVSNHVVGCIDIYPTLLDLVDIKTSATHKIDGVSLASVLKQSGALNRSAYFTWFPHLVPGVVVRQGPWKLIRRFEERPDEYEGLHELFNLDDDLTEATNLARKHPEKVAELNKLIDQFLRETNALTPKRIPNTNQSRAQRPSTSIRRTGWCRGGAKSKSRPAHFA